MKQTLHTIQWNHKYFYIGGGILLCCIIIFWIVFSTFQTRNGIYSSKHTKNCFIYTPYKEDLKLMYDPESGLEYIPHGEKTYGIITSLNKCTRLELSCMDGKISIKWKGIDPGTTTLPTYETSYVAFKKSPLYLDLLERRREIFLLNAWTGVLYRQPQVSGVKRWSQGKTSSISYKGIHPTDNLHVVYWTGYLGRDSKVCLRNGR